MSAMAGRQRSNRGEAMLVAIVEGWPQEKRGLADLARKIDGIEEAGNSAVGRGRGLRLRRLPGLQGQMRAAASAGCAVGEEEGAAVRQPARRGCRKEQHFYDKRNRGATTDGEEGDEFVNQVQRKGCAEVDAQR
ncbi:hypothetical protein GW17_00045797 [Ensete ventricosum]|nr:hypothetical protein GW17_00045797 [Ensete ventricosum]